MDHLEFNVSHLMREAIGASHIETVVCDEPIDLETTATERLEGVVELVRTNFGVLARVELSARVELKCDRCLEPFHRIQKSSFEEEFLPVVDVATGRPVQSERTDDTFFISRDHVIDLTEAVRQYELLELPMIALCKDGCLGLCPICGANWNSETCSCQPEEVHPLAGIAEMLAHPAGTA